MKQFRSFYLSIEVKWEEFWKMSTFGGARKSHWTFSRNYVLKEATVKFSAENIGKYIWRSTYLSEVAGFKALTLLIVLCCAPRFGYFFKWLKNKFFPRTSVLATERLNFYLPRFTRVSSKTFPINFDRKCSKHHFKNNSSCMFRFVYIL